MSFPHKRQISLTINDHILIFSGLPVRGEIPETPGQIPACAGWQDAWDRIKTMRAQGAAAHDAKKAHPAAIPQAMAGDRLIGIFRTGRQMTAGIADEG